MVIYQPDNRRMKSKIIVQSKMSRYKNIFPLKPLILKERVIAFKLMNAITLSKETGESELSLMFRNINLSFT